MAFTPLIKNLNQQGTTFYTFSSAARDLSKCIGNSQKEFSFSHFVCLNLPDIININNYDQDNDPTQQNGNHSSYCPGTGGSSGDLKNYLQFGGVHDLLYRDYDENPQKIKSSSQELAELLQDYVLNCEELLISESDDQTTDRSVAERVFWHWMKNMGAINWKYDASVVAPSLLNHQKMRFVEGADDIQNYTYNNVVQYIGNIDITNSVDIANEAYTEIYIHIPTEAGNTQNVLFLQEFDGNFEENMNRQVPNNQGFIIGQDGSISESSYNVDLRALYDTEPTDTIKRYIGSGTIPFGGNVSTTLDDTSYDNRWKINAYKSDLDGVCIDFDPNSYRDIVLNNIPNMDAYNKKGQSFEFNAVLVYYDIVNLSSQTKTSNLYGVLFLDDVKSDSWDYFQRYPKYKPISGVQNGNSYGFKLNLRIDVEPDQTGITTLVNEYNTFSMSMFGDAMARIQECANSFIHLRDEISKLNTRLSDLENVMTAINNYQVIAAQVQDLEQQLQNANMAFANSNSLLDLIAHVSDNVDSIMNGTATVELQYNTDVVKEGYNTQVDTNTPNEIKINTLCGGYNIVDVLLNDDQSLITKQNPIDLSDTQRQNNDIYIKLKEMSNMARIWVKQNSPALYDINIYIDSSLVKWKEGQNVKLVFPDMTLNDLNLRNIIIFTGTNYDIIHKIYNNDLMGNRPIIEITCIDETLTSIDPFVHDVLR